MQLGQDEFGGSGAEQAGPRKVALLLPLKAATAWDGKQRGQETGGGVGEKMGGGVGGATYSLLPSLADLGSLGSQLLCLCEWVGEWAGPLGSPPHPPASGLRDREGTTQAESHAGFCGRILCPIPYLLGVGQVRERGKGRADCLGEV